MSEILDNWRAGKGLPGVLVIDGHTHVGEWPHGANFDSVDDMAAGAAAVMDANGVDAACVMSGGYMSNGTDYRLGNDILVELTRRLPQRIIPFAHVNPNDHLDAILAELERVHAAGMRCIKLLNAYQGYPGDGPNLMALYRFAADHNMLILNHSWTNEEIVRIAREFPTVDFIFGHYGHRQDPVLTEFPNVYANIWTLASLGFLERGIRSVGPEKFLYGSDAFMNPISVGIGLVACADVPDEHKRLILGLTQARLLEKVGALPDELKRKMQEPSSRPAKE
jgi:predicted TIM-barrel fold metal-dependent hydrolase